MGENLRDGAILADDKLVRPGFHYNPKDNEIWFSTEALERALDSFERIAALFFDWAGNHPYEFTLVILLLGFFGYLRIHGATDRRRMELTFDQRRSDSRIPELPLQPPSKQLPAPEPSKGAEQENGND